MTIKTRTETRDVGPLTLRGDVGTLDEKARTVEMTFSTGARVFRPGWFTAGSYEELSMDPGAVRMGRLNSGSAPFLRDHYGSVDNVLGVIDSARLEGGKGIAKVRFPPEGIDERADQVFAKIRAGIIKNVSVGYRIWRAEKSGKAEYQGEEVPVFRATDWEPHEVSAVAIGADPAASFRSEDVLSNKCVFVTRQERKMEGDDVNPGGAPPAAAAPAAPPAPPSGSRSNPPPPPGPEIVEAEQRAAKLERERIAGIQHAARAAKMPEAQVTEHVSKGTSLEAFRKLVIDSLADRSDATAIDNKRPAKIEVGEEDRDKTVRGMTAAILSRSGMLPVLAAVAAGVKSGEVKIPGVRHAFKDFDPDDDGGQFRSLKLASLARESLERRGVNTRRMDDHEIVGRALTMKRDIGGEATISDFAVVLENVMYKVLLGNYAQAADTWRRFCGVDSVQDFRPSNRYRTGSFGVLDLKGEAAEYQHKSIPDGLKFAITTQTYGNMIAVSREAIINDDMGAITDTMAKFGRAAGLTIEKAVFDLLLENSGKGPDITLGGTTAPLFDDTAWKNEGTDAALSVASLEADRVKLAQQKDISNNEYLNLRPAVLLVPLSLEGEANLINTNRYDPTANTAFERTNIVNGLFRDIVGSPRITGVRRYMFVDPGEVAALKVVFLNGAQTPFMDQRLGWNVDGTEMKLRMDMKAQAFDPKGALTNKGST